MSSASETPNTESDSPNTGVLVTIVAVGALAMIGISLAVTALVRYEVDANESEKGATANVRPYREARAEWEKKLSAPPAWVKPGETVSLPVDRAMQLVVAEIQKNPALATRAKPGAGAPGATAADAGAAGTTPGLPAPGGAAPAPGGAAAPSSPGSPSPAGAPAAPGSPGAASGGKTGPAGAKPAPKQPAPAAPAPKPNPQGNAP